jgi:hypothetical protein
MEEIWFNLKPLTKKPLEKNRIRIDFTFNGIWRKSFVEVEMKRFG